MRLIYTKDGFNKNEKEEWRVIIFNNILDGLRMTVDAMEEFGIEFAHENTNVRILNRRDVAEDDSACAALEADLL